MIACPSCSAELPEDSRFCKSCGAALATQSATATATSAPGEARSAAGGVSGAAAGGARFLPGQMLAGRYRIVGLLGRGGMGEVYRADDVKLGRPVALKFLPAGLEREPGRLERLLGEVRVALNVTHPNVCRVHDVGEVSPSSGSGRRLHFLSMEYVDGEDLSSLLRRIGRLPQDKALQVARQICAGLAAAHAQGILHRDLKPANLMLDGRGQVKITDFGLAGLESQFGGAEVRAGTPAYMAPEQHDGREVTVRSDIYALGLVLYELFTGKAAFRGDTVAELVRLHRESLPATPTSLLAGLDPAIERVILRCLEKRPADRPPSALAVAAALPGGDPLAAALAAGETPSPELVAYAGGSGGLRPRFAWGLLAAFAVSLALLIALSGETLLVRMVPPPKPPEVLADRAREIARSAGYDKPPADSVSSLVFDDDYLRYLAAPERAAGAAAAIAVARPSAVLFGYRQSPEPLVRDDPGRLGRLLSDPPSTIPGMVQVILDPEGRLHDLTAVPNELEPAGTTAAADWSVLLDAAKLDSRGLRPVDPRWTPPFFADQRAAWEGVYPGANDVPIRVEAAAFHGRPIAFRIIEPWTRAAEDHPSDAGFWGRASRMISNACFIVVLLGAGVMAFRNVRAGSGDRRGALRLALYLGTVRMLRLLGAHHLPGAAEMDVLMAHLAWSAYYVCLVWMFYLALEPYARRLWPGMLGSWVRLLDGRLRDRLVGRDVLIGLAYGGGVALTVRLSQWMGGENAAAHAEHTGDPYALESLRGLRQSITAVAGVHDTAMLTVLITVMLVLVLRVASRRTWPAVALVSLLGAVLFNPDAGSPWPYLLATAVNFAMFWVVLFRVGLLSIVLGSTVSALLTQLPLTFDLSAWYAAPTLLMLLVLLPLAVWAVRTTLAGRPMVHDDDPQTFGTTAPAARGHA